MTYQPLPDQLANPKPASEHTQAHQQRVRESLPFHDRRSFENAARGFIATMEPLTLHKQNGQVAYDLSQFSFLSEEGADTVNPSLWRQAQLNAQHNGLFEVVEGIYQVRSFDIANMTLIQGDSGWIIIDPLTSLESAKAALDLANQQLGERPVRAVIYTHSHVDHFAGIYGVISPEQAKAGEIPIVAPIDFVDEALSENVMAGNVMGRRATYMYGNLLKPGPQGIVTTGLGAALSMGTTGFAPPNDTVCESGETRTLDGIEFEFQMTMGTEAPAEFVFYLPQFRALCMSEITSHHLHNVYTLRGAQVRDALAWAAQIDEAIARFGDRLDIQFASHHWPIWGRGEALEYLRKQRDLYKFIHDQTLRLANTGFNKEEIAEQIELPPELSQEFYNRGYYGSLHHNSRAVYVKYLGYFDGNPATLAPLPRQEAGRRYVEFMGGADNICSKAQSSFTQGDYRWVVEVLNHVIMTDPEHINARALLADALEQLGYQAESAPWRNFYLCGAQELRAGLPRGSQYKASAGMAAGMPLANVFKFLAVRLLPEQVAARQLSLLFKLSDESEVWRVQIENSVLNAYREDGSGTVSVDVTATASSADMKLLLLGVRSAQSLVDDDLLSIEGQAEILHELPTWFASFQRRFPLVTPMPSAH